MNFLKLTGITFTLCIAVACSSQPEAQTTSDTKNAPVTEEKMTAVDFGNKGRVVRNEYVVTLAAKQSNPESTIQRAFQKYEVKSISQVSGDIYLVRITKDPGIEEVQKVAKENPQVQSVQPNFKYNK